MQYAILCYDHESEVCYWSQEEDDAVMGRLAAVQKKLAQERKLGPVARLMPSKDARTLRRATSTVTDGPFAETKEMLLGFFIVDCATMDEALEAARQLAAAHPSKGSYEVRPLLMFQPVPAFER